MTKDEMKNRISLALKDPILQQGFEIICKNLTDLESTKEELVKSNQTIRSKLRTLKNDYEEYETAHIALVEKYRDLEKENAELKENLEYSKTIMTKLLYNSDEYIIQRAEDFIRRLTK